MIDFSPPAAKNYSQRIFFNLHIPHAPRLRGFHLLFVMGLGGGELPETESVVEAACIGVVAGIVPSFIALRNAATLTWFRRAFYSSRQELYTYSVWSAYDTDPVGERFHYSQVSRIGPHRRSYRQYSLAMVSTTLPALKRDQLPLTILQMQSNVCQEHQPTVLVKFRLCWGLHGNLPPPPYPKNFRFPLSRPSLIIQQAST